MLVDQRKINKIVSEELGLDEFLIKSISDIGFKKTSEWTKNPSSLILKVSRLGKLYFKKAKTLRRLEEIDINRDTTLYLDMEDKFKFIISEYDKYSSEKHQRRHETNIKYPEQTRD